jgi:hypothetical protein
MKKDHPIFVQYLFKSVRKSYNYCSFLDKNGHADFCSVLKVCDFCTIEMIRFNRYHYMYINKYSGNYNSLYAIDHMPSYQNNNIWLEDQLIV